MRPRRDPRLTIDAGRRDDREPGCLRHALQDIRAPPHADGATVYQCRHAGSLRRLHLRPHPRDDISRLGLAIPRLIPCAQIHEDVLMRQDHPQFVGPLRPQCRVKICHSVLQYIEPTRKLPQFPQSKHAMTSDAPSSRSSRFVFFAILRVFVFQTVAHSAGSHGPSSPYNRTSSPTNGRCSSRSSSAPSTSGTMPSGSVYQLWL